MPSVVRFLTILVVLAAVVMAGVVALATLVHVTPRPMEEIVPPARLK